MTNTVISNTPTTKLRHKALIIFHTLKNEYDQIDNDVDYGIISLDDAVIQRQMIKSKERKLIKKLVLEVHVTHNGDPRKIVYQESKGLYYTMLADKKKIYATTEDGLYAKLLEIYGIILPSNDCTIRNIFELALDEKKKTRNRNPGTIEHYRHDFKRFIDDTFAKRDVRNINKYDLREYSQYLVTHQSITVKSFKTYKSVLNLIFKYAKDHDYIAANPVDDLDNSDYYKGCAPSKTSSDTKILSEDEIRHIQDTITEYSKEKRYHGYFINGYCMRFAIETGTRAAEIASLKWEDILDTKIHIHTQQLSLKNTPENQNLLDAKKYYYTINKGKIYYLAPWTKGEKGIPQGGRYYPLTEKVKEILNELQILQNTFGIESEFVFCHEDGSWIKTDAYETCLRRMLQSLGYSVTNNHAFRMSLNSNVFISQLDLPVTERARLLGHSVETNLKHYSFAGKDNLDDICERLNSINQQVSPRSHQKIVPITQKKNLETTNFKAL